MSREKKIFFDQDILQKGFIEAILPKTKIYSRYRNAIVEQAKHSEMSEKVYESIVEFFDLRNRPLPIYLQPQSRKYILAYLSDYMIPDLDNK